MPVTPEPPAPVERLPPRLGRHRAAAALLGKVGAERARPPVRSGPQAAPLPRQRPTPAPRSRSRCRCRSSPRSRTKAPHGPSPGVTARSPPPRRKTSALYQDGAGGESVGLRHPTDSPPSAGRRANGRPLAAGGARRLVRAGRQSTRDEKP